MAQTDEFYYESVQDAETIKEFLQSLLDGMEKGRIFLSSNGNDISLKPANLLKFSVKAKNKGDTSKMNIKISWKKPRPVNITVDNDIEISS